MRVLLFNGSPHKDGTTDAALRVICGELEKAGIETEIFWVGVKPVASCTACGYCKKGGGCAFGADGVNEFCKKAEAADGVILGTPVHFAAASGAATAFLDRAFFSGKGAFALKAGAAIVCARRGGTTAALDQLNKYLFISNMYAAGSQYWNMVHGSNPADILKDEEGLQTMRTLGRNMAYLLKALNAAKEANIPLPEREATIRTNFIR